MVLDSARRVTAGAKRNSQFHQTASTSPTASLYLRRTAQPWAQQFTGPRILS